MSDVLCVLPARLGSRRLPRKPLRRLGGRPLVRWSWEAARRVEAFDAIRVATDSREVAEAVRSFGGRAVLTGSGHPSGTDRVAEVAGRPWASDYRIVVNFQADEPFLPPSGVQRAVEVVRRGEAPVATLAEPMESEERWRSADVVKVVRASDGRALYFSRAPVPHPRGRAVPWADDGDRARPGSDDARPAVLLRHAGVYVFRRRALREWTRLPPSPLEEAEGLEQLRALEAGVRVHVTIGTGGAPGVDTPGDLERAARRIEASNHWPGDGDGA